MQSKRYEVLAIQKENEKLEEKDEVKRYLNLLDLLEEKTTGSNGRIDKFTDREIIKVALNRVDITPDEEIYVYIGTYKINYEIDIVHGSNDLKTFNI